MKTKMIEQQQEQEQISPELISKFDGDRELVTQFLEAGYTQQELQGSEGQQDSGWIRLKKKNGCIIADNTKTDFLNFF